MSYERVSSEFYIEGLTRLAAHVKEIEYHKTAWEYALHVCRQSQGTFEAAQQLEELATWRTFCADIIDELKAAHEIGRRNFQIELLACYRLAVALEGGWFRDDRQLLLEVILELDTVTIRLLNPTQAPIDHVTLSQCAAIIRKSKRTLENWKSKDMTFPTPEVIGGDGKADEWLWTTIRPYLQSKVNRQLPEIFPAHVTA
jgi:hypothetical protein